MASAADLLLKIRADIGDASKNITTLENQLKGFGSGAMGGTATLEQNLRKAQPAGIALAAVGGAITAGFAGAIATAADFEKSMSGIKSLMAPADIEKFGGALEKLALQLGKETAFTASAAASGIEELVKAGVPLEAILGGAAAAALDLAAATGIPVPEAAGFAASAMNAFKKNASELTGVMDTLAGVANASAADMTDLRFGFQAVGSVAPLVGMSFEDTATALGLFANNGLRGSDAGTSLKTMLMNLTPRTAKVAELMKELGIITADGANKFFDAKGKFIGLAGAADVLQAALKDMTPEEQMEALKKLFGSDAIRAGGILMREGAKGVNDLKAAMAGMTVADMAKTRLDNMKGSMEQLKGSLETAAIVIGTILIPPIRSLVDWGTRLLNKFLELPAPVQTAIIAVVGIAGAIMALVGGLILAGPFLVALPAAFAAIGPIAGVVGGAIAGVAGAIAAVALPVLAIIAVVGLLYLAWTNNWGGIREIAASVWTFLQGVFSSLVDWLGSTIPAVTQTLADVWNNVLMPAFRAVWGFVQNYVIPLFSALVNVAMAALDLATRAMAGLWQNVLQPAFMSVWNAIQNSLMPVISALMNSFLTPLADLIRNNIGPVLAWLKTSILDPVIGAFNSIAEAISGVIRWLNDLANTLRNLALPSWLEPGSPTPFELALLGIAGALRDVDRAWGMFEGGLPPATFNAVSAGAGAAGGTAGRTAATVTINGPIVGSITVAGEADEDRLVAKLHEMLVTGLSTALGQGTRFPAGVGVNR